MGYKLKNLFKKGAELRAGGLGTVPLAKRLFGGSGNGDPGQLVDVGPEIGPPPLGLPEGASKRRSLMDLLKEPGLNLGLSDVPNVGPSIEDDSKAFQDYLAASEAQRAREEARATEGILGQLQGRGIAKSGIALKDVVEHVLGPSFDRSGQLAAQFGLEQARNRSALLENQRQAARGLQSQRQGGILSAILGDQGYGGQFDLANLGALQDYNSAKQQHQFDLQNMAAQDAISQRRAFEQRRRRRKGALLGLLGGAAGGYFGGPMGAMAGQQLGQSAGETF